MVLKFRTLKANEIDCRVGQVNSKGYTILLYKDARCDMNILDETVGAENWQREHYEVKDNMFCKVGIYNDATNTWVWKSDCGTESNTEKEKGEASDSFKRACVNWGIGRELYTTPFIFIDCKTLQRTDGKYDIPPQEKYAKLHVAEIEYNDFREITTLVIVDVNGEVRFTTKNGYNTKENKSNNNLIVGGKFEFSSGRFKGKTIEEVAKTDKEYLNKLLDWDKCPENVRKNIETYLQINNQSDVGV